MEPTLDDVLRELKALQAEMRAGFAEAGEFRQETKIALLNLRAEVAALRIDVQDLRARLHS